MKKLEAWAIVLNDMTHYYHIYRTRHKAKEHATACFSRELQKEARIVKVEIREVKSKGKR